MSQVKDRIVAVIENEAIANTIVIPDGVQGDEMLAENPTWVEITDMDPMPGVGVGWKYVKGRWVAPPLPAMTTEMVESLRHASYAELTDPLFFKYQRGEASEKEWLDAVQAVKDAYPYPEA